MKLTALHIRFWVSVKTPPFPKWVKAVEDKYVSKNQPNFIDAIINSHEPHRHTKCAMYVANSISLLLLAKKNCGKTFKETLEDLIRRCTHNDQPSSRQHIKTYRRWLRRLRKETKPCS